MLIFLIYYIKYNTLLKFISSVSFYLYKNVANRKVSIPYVVLIISLLDSTGMESDVN